MKLYKHFKFSLVCVVFLNMQCNEDDGTIIEPCGVEIQIDNSAYMEADSHLIEEFVINDDCITLTVADSGCDSGNWVMTLIDSGNIAESMPPQRFLKLALVNDEVCLAFLTKQETFDLTPLKVEGLNEVILNIDGLTESITYYY